jgi:hypothetical protein
VTRYEDRDPVVVVPAPVIDLLDRTPTRQDRAGLPYFVEEVLGRLRELSTRGRGSPLRLLSVREPVPIVQPHEVVATGVVRFVVRARDVPVD